MPCRVALVGVTGYGRQHLTTIHRLGLPLAGVCDLRELPPDLVGDAPVYQDLDRMLAECEPDITIVATPIHTHAEIAEAALRAGSTVLLEKPPVTSLAELDRLIAVTKETGRQVEVGFQTMGSNALRQLRRMIENGDLGEIEGIGAYGAWYRSSAYYARAEWAGRREYGDGALTNPFAHAVMAALWLAGAEHVIPSIELELFHANDITADDTFCMRATADGIPPVVVSGTLCAENYEPATIGVHGSDTSVDLEYESDLLIFEGWTKLFDRVDQLANLAAGADPLCPLETTRTFTSVVEAITNAAAPTPIDPQYWHDVRTGDGTRRVVTGVNNAVGCAAGELKLFSEQGIDWKGRT